MNIFFKCVKILTLIKQCKKSASDFKSLKKCQYFKKECASTFTIFCGCYMKSERKRYKNVTGLILPT